MDSVVLPFVPSQTHAAASTSTAGARSSLRLLEASNPQAPAFNKIRGLLFTIISGFPQFLTRLSQVLVVHTPQTSLLLVVNSSYPPHMTDNEYESQY